MMVKYYQRSIDLNHMEIISRQSCLLKNFAWVNIVLSYA